MLETIGRIAPITGLRERDARGHDGARGVHGQRAVGPHRRRGGDHRQRLRDVAEGEDALGAETITRVCGERSQHDGGNELDHGDDARLADPAALVGVDEDRQPGRVLGEGEGDERRLDAQQLWISGHAPDNFRPRSVHRTILSERRRSISRSPPVGEVSSL